MVDTYATARHLCSHTQMRGAYLFTSTDTLEPQLSHYRQAAGSSLNQVQFFGLIGRGLTVLF